MKHKTIHLLVSINNYPNGHITKTACGRKPWVDRMKGVYEGLWNYIDIKFKCRRCLASNK